MAVDTSATKSEECGAEMGPVADTDGGKVRAWLAQDGKPLFVHCGISGGTSWGTFHRKASGSLKRVVSQAMPMVSDRGQAQANLDKWARKHKLQEVLIDDPARQV